MIEPKHGLAKPTVADGGVETVRLFPARGRAALIGSPTTIEIVTPPKGQWRRWLFFFRHFLRGKYLPERLERVMTWVGTPAVIALLAFGLAAYASMFAADIRTATRGVFESGPHRVEWWVLAFWIVLTTWTILIYLRYIAEEHMHVEAFYKTSEVQADLFEAATHYANPAFFESYAARYQKLADDLHAALNVPEPGRASELEKGIRAVMVEVALMAQRFARAEHGASYGANVMLIHTAPYPKVLLDKLRFFDRRRYPSEKLEEAVTTSLSHILYLPNALLLPNREGKPARVVPDIALPVPFHNGDGTSPYSLPGAPLALASGRASVYEDTRKLADEWCAHFDEFTRQEVRTYFSADGQGKDVVSFASFRIGTSSTPVGVLNIDSNRPAVLGRINVYFPPFEALLTPILRVLRQPVAEYARLAIADGRLFGEPAHVSAVDIPQVSSPS